MAILSFRTSTFARNIILIGSERLTPRDGCNGVPRTPDDYYGPVEQFAADKYYIEQLDNALVNGWINQTEYGEIIDKKGPGDPQNQPITLLVEGTEGS
jgi:hypothetical protein